MTLLRFKKVQAKNAQTVTLAPTEPLRIVGAEGYLGEYLLGSLLSTGDTIPISIMGQRVDSSSDLYKAVWSSFDYGLYRNDSVRRKRKSSSSCKGSGVPSISYEDIGGVRNEISRVREMIELH